jgi:hypothetical protein
MKTSIDRAAVVARELYKIVALHLNNRRLDANTLEQHGYLCGNDAAGERKQEMRPVDKQDLLQNLFGRVLDQKKPAIGQFEQEQRLVVGLGGNAEFEFHLEAFAVEATRLKIDAEIDRRPGGQIHGRAGILEGQILHVLPDNRDSKRRSFWATTWVAIRTYAHVAHEMTVPEKRAGLSWMGVTGKPKQFCPRNRGT